MFRARLVEVCRGCMDMNECWGWNCGCKKLMLGNPGNVIMVSLMLVLGVIRLDWFVTPVVPLMLGVVVVERFWRDRFDLGLATFSCTAGPVA